MAKTKNTKREVTDLVRDLVDALEIDRIFTEERARAEGYVSIDDLTNETGMSKQNLGQKLKKQIENGQIERVKAKCKSKMPVYFYRIAE